MITMITLEDFYIFLDNLECYEDVIVKLAYKYDWEKDYTMTNEYLQYVACKDDWEWLNDWHEGQKDVVVIGFIFVSEVAVNYFTDKILRK